MINAIFIQSFSGEIKNGSLQLLLDNLYDNLNKKNTKIIIFLDSVSSTFEELINFPRNSNIDIIYVLEEHVINPVTKIFQFIMNYGIKEYEKILIIESDCVVKKNFDLLINQDLKKIKNDQWCIYGSHYYGLEPWMNTNSEDGKFRKRHMNGVAVYNRNEKFINIINNLIAYEDLINNETNYDFAIHKAIKDLNIYQNMINGDMILNISRWCDVKLRHEDLKPECALVHTKNKNYSFYE